MKKCSYLLATALALLLGASIAAPEGKAAGFGPKLAKCGPLKGAAKSSCKKQNAATRTVFNQVKDARFTGTHFGGTSVDALFCANGKWRITVALSESQTFSGKGWTLTEASVGRRYLGGLATGPSNNIFTRVGLSKRSGKWFLSNRNPSLSAPEAKRTPASAECAALEV